MLSLFNTLYRIEREYETKNECNTIILVETTYFLKNCHYDETYVK